MIFFPFGNSAFGPQWLPLMYRGFAGDTPFAPAQIGPLKLWFINARLGP